MHKLRTLLRKFKVTVMVIPNADHHIKQRPINLAHVIIVLTVLLIANIVLVATTVTSKYRANVLDSQNIQLVSEMTYQSDQMNSLESLSDSRLEEILALRTTLENSVDYLDQRLAAIEEADTRIDTLLSMFNAETNSNIAVPVSRSYDRDTILRTSEAESSDENLFLEIESLVENEEISSIIESKTDAYDTLINKLETQLIYLECRPDAVPAEGLFTSKFGYRKDPVTKRTSKHEGIDIANAKGTPIYAAGSGIVTYSGYSASYGNIVIIDHGYGYKSVYAHCNELLINEGAQVNKGDLIAKMGSTGKSTGTHLHFEIRFNDNPINPLTILNLDQ